MTTKPKRCDTCGRETTALVHLDFIPAWWCLNRVACDEAKQERFRDVMVGELPDSDDDVIPADVSTRDEEAYLEWRASRRGY